MISLIKNSEYTAYFSTKKEGNVDPRFSNDALLNRNRLLAQLHIERVAWMKAQGETDIQDITGISINKWNEYPVDAIISSVKNGASLALYPADCIPLIITAANSDILALVHVGRRNAEAGIVQKVFEYIFNKYELSARKMRVYVGPSIMQDSYYFRELDEYQLTDPQWKGLIEHIDGLYYVDLMNYVLNRLSEIKIDKRSIVMSGIDTGADPNYFSHARSVRTNETEGRNLFVIKPKGV